MSVKNLRHRKTALELNEYQAFDQLDGSHPWKECMPEGYVGYRVRKLAQGQVAYFNFALAAEMGLIPKNHTKKLNKKLEQKILDTFCLRIINEYDQEKNITYPEKDLKANTYMATRYLQLQHANKKGATSGDGRCIWNGVVANAGRLWDVSSRGTGVTQLAPGAVEAQRPLESGNTDFGYGCGLAEIDELYSAAIMAEIFYRKGIQTERVLALIDFGDGTGIGVRAAPNLLRPAHLFMYLKQGQLEPLKRAADYLILRQQKNGAWKFGVHKKNRYDLMLEELVISFAFFIAQLDREYIFAWLDWDGDNVLASAGIIDYGSVRQFGLRHDKYRYDDVERWSTNLNEQKSKAKLMLQVFVQAIDFLKTGKKKPLEQFKGQPILEKFESHYQYFLLERFLYQIGFEGDAREQLIDEKRSLVEALFADFCVLERTKTQRKPEKVADGVNHPAIFNMRNLARELPRYYLSLSEPLELVEMDSEQVLTIILSEFASRRDAKPRPAWEARFSRLQKTYKELVLSLAGSEDFRPILQSLSRRAAIINRPDRLTGNALLYVVNEILDERKAGLEHSEVQKVIDQLILSQSLLPEEDEPHFRARILSARRSKTLFNNIIELVQNHSEDI